MNRDMFSSADYLQDENNQGYVLLPIPSPRDAEITSLLREWAAMDEPSRSAALAQISDAQRWTLLGYSERMASLGVRDRKRERIVLGLLALGLDGWHDDWRDNAVLICLHYDAARRIGLLPEHLFEEAAKLLPEKPAEAVRSFLRRTDGEKSLEAMGYIAATDADGFRYQRTW